MCQTCGVPVRRQMCSSNFRNDEYKAEYMAESFNSSQRTNCRVVPRSNCCNNRHGGSGLEVNVQVGGCGKSKSGPSNQQQNNRQSPDQGPLDGASLIALPFIPYILLGVEKPQAKPEPEKVDCGCCKKAVDKGELVNVKGGIVCLECATKFGFEFNDQPHACTRAACGIHGCVHNACGIHEVSRFGCVHNACGIHEASRIAPRNGIASDANSSSQSDGNGSDGGSSSDRDVFGEMIANVHVNMTGGHFCDI